MQVADLKAKGLYTHPNPLDLPQGALLVCSNMVIDREGVTETRRGFKRYGTVLTLGAGERPNKLYEFKDKALLHYGTTLAYDSDDAGTWTNYSGSYSPPTNAARIRSVRANSNFYFTTNAGIKKLDAVTGTVTQAGALKALDGTGATSGASGFMTNNTQVAYRIVVGITDANQNKILGTPSQRIIVINNSGGTRDVALSFALPSGITTSHVFQIYRSAMSSGVGVEPNDELQLIVERNPTAGEVTALSVSYTDATPESLRGATLYTSPSQQGIAQANEPPPLARDIAFYKNHVLYLNTITKHRLNITMISVGGSAGVTAAVAATVTIQNLVYTAATAGSAGNSITIAYTTGAVAGSEVVSVVGNAISVQIQSGVSTNTQIKTKLDASGPAMALISVATTGGGGIAQTAPVSATALAGGRDATTITIAGTLYTGKATETAASGFFKVTTSGTASENIDATARSLISVINRYASNTLVYAYYLSGYNDLPGQILIEERGIGGSSFVAISNTGTAFSPTIPSSGSTYISSNETKKNRLYISKQQQPEAVPLLNYIDIGSADADGLRVIALRDSTFILKEDGIFRMTGETIADFRVALFDNTTTLIAEDTACAFNNQVFGFADQGVVAISDAGVQIMSRQIEADLLQFATLTNFSTIAWACAYESDRKYILAIPSASGDTYPTVLYVFNAITSTWTTWDRSMSAGLVISRDNKLYFGSALTTSKYVYQERKTFTIQDNADEEVAITIVSSAGTTITVASTTGLSVGWQVAQFSGSTLQRSSKITSITDATHLVVDDTLSWAAAAATVYAPIEEEVTYAPIHGGNPGVMKHFNYLSAMFSNAEFDELTMSFTSDMSVSVSSIVLQPQREGPWGFFPWGMVAWGGAQARLQPIPTLIPLEKARCTWLNLTLSHSQALSKFSLTGISLFFELMSARRR